MINFGLASTAQVRWLIGSDKSVYDAVVNFFMGNVDRDFVEVVGPPTDEDHATAKRRGDKAVPLPVVRLQMRPAVHSVTGEHGVEVLCSDRDLEEISRWQRRALLDFAKKGMPQ